MPPRLTLSTGPTHFLFLTKLCSTFRIHEDIANSLQFPCAYKRLYSRKHSSKQVADLSDVRGRLDGLRTDGRGGSLDTSSVDNTVLRKAIGASSEWWHMGTGSSISTKECCSQRTPDLENQAIAPQCSHAHLSSCAKVTLYTMEDRELT